MTNYFVNYCIKIKLYYIAVIKLLQYYKLQFYLNQIIILFPILLLMNTYLNY